MRFEHLRPGQRRILDRRPATSCSGRLRGRILYSPVSPGRAGGKVVRRAFARRRRFASSRGFGSSREPVSDEVVSDAARTLSLRRWPQASGHLEAAPNVSIDPPGGSIDHFRPLG